MERGYITTQIVKELDTDIKFSVAEPVDPQDFFKNRRGLWVSSDFESRILADAKTVAAFDFKMESLELTQDATDAQIEESLEHKNIFKESDVCAIIAHLISQQPKGEKGILLEDGKWNLFYTASFVVYVGWYGDEWSVGAWDRVDGRWGRGLRVFSPAIDRS